MRLQVGTRLGDAVGQFVEDVHATFLSLVERTFQNVEREAVDLDIHLCGSDTIPCSRHLEVHVAQVILITEDVGEDGILVFAGVLDKSHGNTRHGLLDGHTRIHQRQRSGTYRCH